MLAIDDLVECADRVLDLDELALQAGELLSDEEWLRQELLHLASASDDKLVVFRQFVHPENRDDVLKVLVALQNGLHASCSLVMLFAHDAWIQHSRSRGQRIDRWINPELGD